MCTDQLFDINLLYRVNSFKLFVKGATLPRLLDVTVIILPSRPPSRHQSTNSVSPSCHLLFWSRQSFWNLVLLKQCPRRHSGRNQRNSENKQMEANIGQNVTCKRRWNNLQLYKFKAASEVWLYVIDILKSPSIIINIFLLCSVPQFTYT